MTRLWSLELPCQKFKCPVGTLLWGSLGPVERPCVGAPADSQHHPPGAWVKTSPEDCSPHLSSPPRLTSLSSGAQTSWNTEGLSCYALSSCLTHKIHEHNKMAVVATKSWCGLLHSNSKSLCEILKSSLNYYRKTTLCSVLNGLICFLIQSHRAAIDLWYRATP